MEIRRQRCQACGGYELHNILVREPRLRTAVYVRCAECRELVARYSLADYYHHGKGMDSFLRSRTASVAESGRDLLELFERAKQRAIEGYARVVEELARQGKDF